MILTIRIISIPTNTILTQSNLTNLTKSNRRSEIMLITRLNFSHLLLNRTFITSPLPSPLFYLSPLLYSKHVSSTSPLPRKPYQTIPLPDPLPYQKHDLVYGSGKPQTSFFTRNYIINNFYIFLNRYSYIPSFLNLF